MPSFMAFVSCPSENYFSPIFPKIKHLPYSPALHSPFSFYRRLPSDNSAKSVEVITVSKGVAGYNKIPVVEWVERIQGMPQLRRKGHFFAQCPTKYRCPECNKGFQKCFEVERDTPNKGKLFKSCSLKCGFWEWCEIGESSDVSRTEIDNIFRMFESKSG